MKEKKFNPQKLLSKASGLVRKLKDHKKQGNKEGVSETTEEIKEIVSEITEAMNDSETTPEDKKKCSVALKAIAGLLLVAAGAFGIKTAVGKLKKAKDNDNPSNEINSTLNEIKSGENEEISDKAEEALEMYCTFVALESNLSCALEAALTGEDDEIEYDDDEECFDDIEECGSTGWFESMEAMIDCLETDLALEDFGMGFGGGFTDFAAQQAVQQQQQFIVQQQQDLAVQQANQNMQQANQMQNMMNMAWLSSIKSQLNKNKKAKETGDKKAERESIQELEKSTKAMDYAIDKAKTPEEKKKIAKGVKIVAGIAAIIAASVVADKAVAKQLENVAKSDANPPKGIGKLIAKVAKLKGNNKATPSIDSFMDEYDDNFADECGDNPEFDEAMDCLNAELENFCSDEECFATEDNLGAMDRPTKDDVTEDDECYTSLDALLDSIF